MTAPGDGAPQEAQPVQPVLPPQLPAEIQAAVLESELDRTQANRLYLLGLVRLKDDEIAALRSEVQHLRAALESMRLAHGGVPAEPVQEDPDAPKG